MQFILMHWERARARSRGPTRRSAGMRIPGKEENNVSVILASFPLLQGLASSRHGKHVGGGGVAPTAL